MDRVIEVAMNEVGYLEKSKSAYQKDNAVLYKKTEGAGSDNYTKYGFEMHKIYPSVMDFPAAWCDCFVDWCFYVAYGLSTAKSMLGGNFDDYTVSSAQMYKNKKAYIKRSEGVPKVGDQIFFNNGTRICHTGIVYKVDSKNVYTIEGNTSNASGVVANGGGVAKKSYLLTNTRIDGYGRPDYSLAEMTYKVGWNKTNDDLNWWYADSKTTYLKNTWEVINGCKYYFNPDGYALKGWQNIDGKWYYFEPTKGADKECALYVSDANGVQTVGKF